MVAFGSERTRFPQREDKMLYRRLFAFIGG
jgi:hypothetical protein